MKPIRMLLRTVVQDVRRDLLQRYPETGPSLGGLCFLAAAECAARLAHLRVGHRLVVGRHDGVAHAWCEVGELIIDATSGQFYERPLAYVGPRTHHYDAERFDESAVSELIGWLAGQPADQHFMRAVQRWRRNVRAMRRKVA